VAFTRQILLAETSRSEKNRHVIYRPNIVVSALFALSSFMFFGVPAVAAPDLPKPAVKKAKATPQKSSASNAASKDKGKKNASTGGDWNDPDKLQKTLASRVSKKFKSWSGTEINSFLKDDENRLMLANWELIRAMKEDEEAFKKFRVSLKKTAARNFLVKFANDEDWIEGYLYSAPSNNAVDAVNLLRAFSEKDPEIFTVPAIKKIATCVVGEFSRRNWIEDEFETDKELAKKNGPTRVYKRFKFYADSWREGRLNSLFDKLDYWDTRIVVGVTGRTNNRFFGSEESLRWGQDNVKLPEYGYGSPRDIFQMPYRLWNKVGDSVHREEYYAPFNKWYKRVQLKEAQEVGCVCGGVSHFGATAACANGIPGVTMGEPGHCAFAVRVGGKWRDNNSISWERGMHWRLWDDENDWSFLHLTQSLFEDKKNTPNSFRTAVLARISASAKNPDDARTLAIFEHALEIQPLNFPIWREYLTFAKDKKKDDKNFWKEAHKKICDAFNPTLPEIGAVLLGKYVYPTLLPLTQNDDEKIALFSDFWEKTDGWGMAGRWDCESVWDYEIKTLGAGSEAFSAFRKNYDAKNPTRPGDDPAKKRYKEKIGASAGSNKDFSKHFENWKNGAPRK